MKYLIAIIRLIFLAIVSLLFATIGRLLMLFTGNSVKVSRFIVRNWARTSLMLLNIRVHFSGIEPIGKAILMANHRSYIDIFLVLSHYPSSIVAKKELGKWPIIGGATRLARMILVDRGRTSSMINTMNSIKAEIDNGGSVVLFPEGGIKTGLHTATFKQGSFKIASMTNTPIIPAAIYYPNTTCYWGNESFFTHFCKNMGRLRNDVYFWIGAPIKADSVDMLLTTTKEAIDERLTLLDTQHKPTNFKA